MDSHANFAYSTVASAPSPANSGTSLTVQTGDGANYASTPFNATVAPVGAIALPSNAEIVRVNAIAGDVLTLIRAQEGSTPRSILVGDAIYAGPTGRTFSDIENYLGMQQGVDAAASCVLSAVSVNSSTGVVTYTLSAAPQLWVPENNGVLMPVNSWARTGSTFTPGVLPASAKYRGYGIELDNENAITFVSGSADQSTLALALTNINTVAPTGRVRVADIVLLNTAGVYSVAGTRDRRPWSQGGYSRIVRNSNAAAANDYATTSSTMTLVDSANLAIRMECTGAPVRTTLRGRMATTAAATYIGIGMYLDGSGPDGATTTFAQYLGVASSAELPLDFQWDWVGVTPGSHLFQPTFSSTSGKLLAEAGIPLIFTVEELVKLNANNGTS